jgi:hypothetical protein
MKECQHEWKQITRESIENGMHFIEKCIHCKKTKPLGVSDTHIGKTLEDLRNEMRCQHEWKKTLAKSGMHFISMCHKCKAEKPYGAAEHIIEKLFGSLKNERTK